MLIVCISIAGVAIMVGGVAAGGLFCCEKYYCDNQKENALLFFAVGVVSMLPIVLYLFVLLKEYGVFITQ